MGSTDRPVGRLRTDAVLQTLCAPELERYLSRRSVDLLVTDQIEALQVRVREAVAVLERRVVRATEEARRRWRRWLLVAFAGTVVLILGSPGMPLNANVTTRSCTGSANPTDDWLPPCPNVRSEACGP